MRFEKVILVGSGKIACDCLRHLVTLVNADNLIVLETQNNALSMLARVCAKEKIYYVILEDKKSIERFLLEQIEDSSTLIISANNRFIFTPRIIRKEHVEIINFHYALLPHYRGMNIPTWVIYNQEKQTGITWHYVTEQIDHGKIITQRIIPIDSTTIAFEITRKGMVLGLEAFRSFIGELLERQIEGEDIEYPESDKIYYNSQLPMNGMIDLEKSFDDIVRLLRSFDYGALEVVPFLRLYYKDDNYIVKNYVIEKREHSTIRELQLIEDKLFIAEGYHQIILQLQKYSS